ncbi:MAG: amino acid adenylation domain-containing protein, partial [bacterium]|nr:amino acid adenylation domain-containing protein [bacterium]
GGGEKEEELIERFLRPFNLQRAPLMRVGVIKKETAAGNSIPSHTLLLDMHHIIADGVSFGLLIKDFMRLFNGEELPPLRIQYRDFSEWQNHRFETPEMKKQQTWWLREFEKESEELELPYDYTRPARQSFAGSRIFTEIEAKRAAALKEMALKEDVTLFMVLIALYYVLLSRLANREDVVVGVPAAGRSHTDLDPVIGMFINTLPMRSYPEHVKTFESFLEEVGQQTLLAFENQAFPFEEQIEQLELERNLSRNPLFDVMFTLNNFEVPRVEISGLSLSSYEMESKVSKFDLTLRTTEIEEKIRLEYEYCTALFNEETVRRFDIIFQRILDTVLETPGISLQQVDIVPEEEKRRILFEFNDTATDYSSHRTIHRLFEEQVLKTPSRTALIGGMQGDGEEQRLTYMELNDEADRLACLLKNKGIMVEDIVAVIVERSVEMMVGIFAILKAGGAYLPIIPDYPAKRVEFMLKDSGTKIILAGGNVKAMVKKIKAESEVLFLDQQPEAVESSSSYTHQPPVRSSNLAYIIYTSGSTGVPKGVLIEHHSLVNRLQWKQKNYPIGTDDVILQKTVFTFDVSVWELFWWGMYGATLCLLEPGDEKDPMAMVETIEKHSVTVMHFVPSMLSTFLEYIESSRCSGKLAGLKQVFASGEALALNQAERFNRFLNRTNGTRLANLYGPTEATIDVTYFNCSTGDILVKIPIGKPVDNTSLYIVDRTMKTQFQGGVGELCLAGVQLARGYLNNLELTAEKFIKNPFNPGTYLYRTGDLARWLPDGNVEYLGRIDHQVKIRGFRIELGEIENRLLKHEAVKEAVVNAFAGESGDKMLCAYIVTGDSSSPGPLGGALKEHLARELPGYMIPTQFVTMEQLPLTTSGKVDRKRLPKQAVIGTATYVAPQNEVEKKLAGIWAEVLGSEEATTGIDDNFLEMGGHSLKATTLAYRINKELNVSIELGKVFTHPTIRRLARHLKQQEACEYISIEPMETKSYYALSPAQKRLFLLQQIQGTGIGYNMPLAVLLEGNLDRERLENTFRKLIDRHESLRTSFELKDGEAGEVQLIHTAREIEFGIEYVDISGTGDNEVALIESFVRPFDLFRAPLMRVAVIKRENPGAGSTPSHILMLDMHHIISDGVSLGLFVRDFMRLFNGEQLPPLRIQYKDFSEWQKRRFETLEIKKQQNWWLGNFEEKIDVMELPYDYPRPPLQSFAGSSIYSEIGGEKTTALKALVLTEEMTLFMALLSSYNVLLSRLANLEDVVVGVPTAGRSHADLEPVIGMFVNTLPLRSYPEGTKTFESFMKEVAQQTLQAFENQALPFEELVEQLDVERNLARNPLFDVMFTLNNFEVDEIEIPGLRLTQYKRENKAAKFDLTLSATEVEDKILLEYEYCTALFKEETALRFDAIFQRIINTLIENPGTRLEQIDITPGEEKKRILYEFNQPPVDYPGQKTIHDFLEHQAQKNPGRLALRSIHGNHEGENGELTFRQLNDRAHQLAVILRQKGIEPGQIVAIMEASSLEMVVGIVSILKAGGAWLPISPEAATERIVYMLTDSNASLLLIRRHNKGKAGEIRGRVRRITKEEAPGLIFIDEHMETEHMETDGKEAKKQLLRVEASNPAYIIYTSGSTGKPKGVVVPHRAFVNRLYTLERRFHFNEGDVVLQKASNTFDVSICELFRGISWGAPVIIAGKVADTDMEELVRIVEDFKVTVIEFVPIVLNLFLEHIDTHGAVERVSGLRQAFVGGEAVDTEIVKRFHSV